MPELPEVEVVRRGLADHVLDRRIARVEVLHPRAVRRHPTGADDFTGRLTGRTLSAAARRGKYLWLELDTAGPGDDALLAHHVALLAIPAIVPAVIVVGVVLYIARKDRREEREEREIIERAFEGDTE